MSDDTAREILIAGGHAIAHVDGLRPTLQALLDSIHVEDVGSAAIVIGVGTVPSRSRPAWASTTAPPQDSPRPSPARVTRSHGRCRRRRRHSTSCRRAGGPALRSHLPLVVTRGGTDSVLGVLALAHDEPIDPGLRPILQAVADLAAVAVERDSR